MTTSKRTDYSATSPGAQITKYVRRLRWALVGPVQWFAKNRSSGRVKAATTARRRITADNIAKVATARELLTLLFYGLWD